MKNYFFVIFLFLCSINLNAQNDFDFKKIILYVDSLLCNDKVFHCTNNDTLIFEPKGKNIYIDYSMNNCVVYGNDNNITINNELFNNPCIGKLVILSSVSDFRNDDNEKILLTFCRSIYKDTKGLYFEVGIRYFYYVSEIDDIVSSSVSIFIYINERDIIDYKLISLFE